MTQRTLHDSVFEKKVRPMIIEIEGGVAMVLPALRAARMAPAQALRGD